MATATLPQLPKGKEFEELIAAVLQGHGYYVERNIIDRQEQEVLELDIITSKYGDGLPESNLYEAKTGSWGFEDIFKIRGWLDYLNMESGCLVVLQTNPNIEFYKKIASSLNVEVVPVPSIDRASDCLASCIEPENIDPIDIANWRFSYWTERQLLRLLKVKKKSVADKKCYAAIDEYFSLINNRTFFTRNVIERAIRLYETFKEFPNISAKLGHELVGEGFKRDYAAVPNSLFAEAYYECKLNDLAISCYVEYRARLAILRSAIDYMIFKKSGKGLNEKTFSLRFGDRKIEYTLSDVLPQSFKDGLKEISGHPFFHRYPVFWQWFLWIFGGFILNDYKDKDYQLLSSKTGIAVDEIPRALESYECLFPRNNGWFIEPPNVNVRMLKLFPVPFMGVGANYRRFVYTPDQKWEGLHLRGSHTRDDLYKWNNVVVELLTRSL